MSQQSSSSKLEKMAAMKESATSKDYSILVTGATGFIGKNFCAAALKDHYPRPLGWPRLARVRAK